MPRGAIEKHISIHTNITAVGPFSIASEIPAIVLPRSGLVQDKFRGADDRELRKSMNVRPIHRSLLSSATSVSRSLASSGARVSLVIASAFGAAFSAIC